MIDNDTILKQMLWNDERIEWRTSPVWKLADTPLWIRISQQLVMIIVAAIFTIFAMLSLGIPEFEARTLESVTFGVLAYVFFTLSIYLWFKAFGSIITLLRGNGPLPNELYVLTNKRLIVISNEKEETYDKDHHCLLELNLEPNGRVYDLALWFGHIEHEDYQLQAYEQDGYNYEYKRLCALECGLSAKKMIVKRFGLPQWMQESTGSTY
jgi:uncharacterized protein with PQ loop repeat